MLFRRNRHKTEQDLEPRLRELLAEAEGQRIPGSDAVVYNRAGDLCMDAGLNDRALQYFGLSIDAFLEAERWDSAAAICRKVLRLSPHAVRPHCTLAWIAIGKGMATDAQAQIRDYVSAAIRAKVETLAIAQLKRMGRTAPNPEVRQIVAEQLLALGDDVAADRLFGMAYREQNQAQQGQEAELLWEEIRKQALLGPAGLAWMDED
jgi:tetratricopeptide (TPR) repeat protein